MPNPDALEIATTTDPEAIRLVRGEQMWEKPKYVSRSDYGDFDDDVTLGDPDRAGMMRGEVVHYLSYAVAWIVIAAAVGVIAALILGPHV